MRSKVKLFIKIFLFTLLLYPIPMCGYGIATPIECSMAPLFSLSYFPRLLLLLLSLVTLKFDVSLDIISSFPIYPDLLVIALISILTTLTYSLIRKKNISALKTTKGKVITLSIIWTFLSIVASFVIRYLKINGYIPLDYIG